MPALDAITHKLAGAKESSKLHVKYGYWAIHLDDEFKTLTTSQRPAGKYRFRRLPVWLKVRQDIFRQKVDETLHKVGDGVLGIADDVCVAPKDDWSQDKVRHKLMQVGKYNGLMFGK